MKRLVSLIGSLMVAAGLALLVYVGISYSQHLSTSAPTRQWTASEIKRGRQIAATFAKRQQVTIPARLKQQLPQAGSEPALRMVIPKIGVNAPIVQTPPVNGVWQVADWAIGHLSTTPSPGTVGNGAYSAHDDIKGEVFKRVGELVPGDRIMLRTRHATYTYIVTTLRTVDPSDTRPLNPTSSPIITLISCTPYWVDTQRLIIQATLKSGRAS